MNERPGLLGRVNRSGVPALLCRLTIGGMFIWMGLVKAMDPVTFIKLIRQYDIVPDSGWWFLNVSVATLPWLEILCGLLLVLGVGIRGTAVLVMAMLAFFTPMVFMRGLGIHHAEQIPFCQVYFDCGCGAGIVNLCYKLAENTILFLAAAFVLISGSVRFCLRPKLIT